MLDPLTITTLVTTVSAAVGATMTLCEIAEKIGLLDRQPNAEAPNPLAEVGFMLDKLPFFDGNSYEIWRVKMRALLESQGLWDIVEGGYKEKRHNAKALRDDKRKDGAALFIILESLDKSVFHCVLHAKNSKQAWDALQNKYQAASMENNFGGIFNTEREVEDKYAEIRNPVFNGSGFEIWSSKMKGLLMSHDVWHLVQDGYSEIEVSSEAIKDVRIKDAKAMIWILVAVDKSVFPCIANATKSKDAWDALQKEYHQGNTLLFRDDENKSMDMSLLSIIDIIARGVFKFDVLYVDYKGIAHLNLKTFW